MTRFETFLIKMLNKVVIYLWIRTEKFTNWSLIAKFGRQLNFHLKQNHHNGLHLKIKLMTEIKYHLTFEKVCGNF